MEQAPFFDDPSGMSPVSIVTCGLNPNVVKDKYAFSLSKPQLMGETGTIYILVKTCRYKA